MKSDFSPSRRAWNVIMTAVVWAAAVLVIALTVGVIGLDEWPQRKSKNLSFEAITAALRRKYADNEQAAINFFAPPSIPGIGKSDGLSLELLSTDGNASPAELYRWLKK